MMALGWDGTPTVILHDTHTAMEGVDNWTQVKYIREEKQSHARLRKKS